MSIRFGRQRPAGGCVPVTAVCTQNLLIIPNIKATSIKRQLLAAPSHLHVSAPHRVLVLGTSQKWSQAVIWPFTEPGVPEVHPGGSTWPRPLSVLADGRPPVCVDHLGVSPSSADGHGGHAQAAAAVSTVAVSRDVWTTVRVPPSSALGILPRSGVALSGGVGRV